MKKCLVPVYGVFMIFLSITLTGSPPVHGSCIGISPLGGSEAVAYNYAWVPPDPYIIVANGYNDDTLWVWNEMQNVTLSEGLLVDWVADPTAGYVTPTGSGKYYINAGTVVSSHYVQWDPDGTKVVAATLHFDSDIFGYITSDEALFNSDAILGLPWVDYNDFLYRGIEPPPHKNTDTVLVGATPFDVDIEWKASTPGDWVRLVTAYSPGIDTPIPSTLVLLGSGVFGLIGFVGRRRKK